MSLLASTWSLVLPLVLLLSACSGFGPHRLDFADACRNATAVGSSIEGHCGPSLEKRTGFDLAFVELTDQGLLHSRQQLEQALALAQPANGDGGGVQVVVFVHGWHHSAAEGDKNVEHFRSEILPRLAERAPRGMRTLGLYVGWRGESLQLSGLRGTTFYDRKSTAEHVARGSVRELFSRLRALHDASKGERRVRVVLIGHSFGGLIVYNAIAESLLDSLVRAGRGGAAQPIADLALVVNPAFEASRFEPLFQVALRQGVPATPRPIFVSITSSADAATATAFPLGRTVNSLFDHEAWTEDDECPDPGPRLSFQTCEGIERGMRLEKMANTRTMGHLPRYWTHELRAADGSVSCSTALPPPDAGSAPVLVPHAPPPHNRFPLWTMRADAALIAGHSEIYDERLWRFVADLADPQVDIDRLCR
jgi:alpha-beta hydrolase superfamily lysophospholipase